jgi:hypothetical protein
MIRDEEKLGDKLRAVAEEAVAKAARRPGKHRTLVDKGTESPAPFLPLPLRFVDCLFKPDEAEELIGDLFEQYNRRASTPVYRKIWLWCQVTHMGLEEAIKLLRLYTRARAGK